MEKFYKQNENISIPVSFQYILNSVLKQNLYF